MNRFQSIKNQAGKLADRAFGQQGPERLRFEHTFGENSYAGCNGVLSVGYDSDGQVRHHQFTRQPLLIIQFDSTLIKQKLDDYMQERWESVENERTTEAERVAWGLHKRCEEDAVSEHTNLGKGRHYRQRMEEFACKATQEGKLRHALSIIHAADLQELPEDEEVQALERFSQAHHDKVNRYRKARRDYIAGVGSALEKEYKPKLAGPLLEYALLLNDLSETCAHFMQCDEKDAPIWIQDNRDLMTHSVCIRMDDPRQIPLLMRALHQFGTPSGQVELRSAKEWQQLDEQAHEHGMFTLEERNEVTKTINNALEAQAEQLAKGGTQSGLTSARV